MDFLRFCVWVNGESVEENANLVIRLLIRRPECLGPALRGEGEGLKSAVMSGEKPHFHTNTIGPWTALPALIEVKETYNIN